MQTTTRQHITDQPVWDLIRCMRFCPQQVGAIRAGEKTMIRQLMKPQPETDHCIMTQAGLMVSSRPIEIKDGVIHAYMGSVTTWDFLPYHVGDILYVPETWRAEPIESDDHLRYAIRLRGTGEDDETVTEFSFLDNDRAKVWAKYRDRPEDEWVSPYFMPKEASRIFLQITKVTVERLRDISEAAAIAEGVLWSPATPNTDLLPVQQFEKLWAQKRKPKDGKETSWEKNPWVWVLSVRQISREEAVKISLEIKKQLG